MHEDTHLFLNPNDVKGFPFELQLANISPVKNHDAVLLMYVSIKIKTNQPDHNDVIAEFSVYHTEGNKSET